MKTLVHTDKELIEETIKKCDICYVGLADTDGTPYVLPMNFGYRDGVIYLQNVELRNRGLYGVLQNFI